MRRIDFEKQYNKLFPDAETKAKAFDMIAEEVYFCNFGRMSKSDMETLLFSLYIDRILDSAEADFSAYSDYTLSKYLGITQSKVSNLKVKKELLYPYEKFDWRTSFKRVVEKARYEEGKIVINIPDRNLYLEIKNAVEVSGGYVDVSLNQSLLKVSPDYFIDLMLAVSDENDRETIRANLKKQIKSKNFDKEYLEKMSFGEYIKKNGKELGIEFLIEVIGKSIPGIGPIVSGSLKVAVENRSIK